MKKLLLLTLLLSAHLTMAANSKLKCAKDVDEFADLGISSNIIGLWIGEVTESEFVLRVFINGDGGLSAFRTIDSPFGQMSEMQEQSICVYKKRTFFQEQGQLYEFYMDGKKLVVADDKFDIKFPQARSEYTFITLKPAKVVIKK